MVKTGTFEEFLATGSIDINITFIVLALLVAATLSFILGKIYIRYGKSLSNRRKFTGNFILLAMTTTLIITIVKSSLALSLGLVGALSIVRFRSAIKEPEELSFLFLCIAIGVGCGAGQLLITTVSFFVISLFLWTRHFSTEKENHQNLHLIISGKNISLKKIVEIAKKNSLAATLKRFDKTETGELEVSLIVDFKSFNCIEKTKRELENLSKSIRISYLDKSGI